MSEKFHCYVCVKFCLYLGSKFVYLRLTLDLNSALNSVDSGQDLFRKHWDHSLVFQVSIKFLECLIMYSCPVCLSIPPDE